MAIDHRADGLLYPKGERRETTKRRVAKTAKTVVTNIRGECVRRDGYCRLYKGDAANRSAVWALFGACRGPSEWSHFNATHRRSKTRGQAPEVRHTTAGSMMLCGYHSKEYDQNRMKIDALDPARGCDGLLRIRKGKHAWNET